MMNHEDQPERGFALELPEGWEPEADPGPFALVARPTNWRCGPWPNLTVIDVDTEAARSGNEDYLYAQLGGIASGLEDPLLLSVTWVQPYCLDLLLAHGSKGADVTSRQRHLLRGQGRSLVATATAADRDWPELMGPIQAAVCSIRATP